MASIVVTDATDDVPDYDFRPPVKDNSVRCSCCSHFWSEHDIYGCQQFECPCLRIDRMRSFDKGHNRAVVTLSGERMCECETPFTDVEHGDGTCRKCGFPIDFNKSFTSPQGNET